MTKKEFLYQVPDIIDHKIWGYAELEIVLDKNDQNGVCYRHCDKTSSIGTYGLTWMEVYQKLSKLLVTKVT